MENLQFRVLVPSLGWWEDVVSSLNIHLDEELIAPSY